MAFTSPFVRLNKFAPGFLVLLTLGMAGGPLTSVKAQTPAATAAPIALEPATQVKEEEHLGYFGDPYPIHLAPWLEPFLPQYISGTTPEVLQCQRPVQPGCFSATPVTVTPSAELQSTVTAAGIVCGDPLNRNIFQALDGSWQMAITLYVHPKGDAKANWTVVAHAHPNEPISLTPPTTWVADTVLVGSLAKQAFANYDGKYLEDNGRLYLIYSKRLLPIAADHDGVVAQAMTSPKELASSAPVTLLGPSDVNGGFNSEYFHTVPASGDMFKLIETGNITKINGKYVMAYSAGDYQQKDYKTGLALSDTLLPAEGAEYRRITMEDTAGVWGQPDHLEVRYLLQSQKPEWPNYVASQIIAPGVPAIVQEADGRWLLFLDGFLPSNATLSNNPAGNPFNIVATLRRPFYVPLNVQVPVNGSVAAATEQELASWITTKTE